MEMPTSSMTLQHPEVRQIRKAVTSIQHIHINMTYDPNRAGRAERQTDWLASQIERHRKKEETESQIQNDTLILRSTKYNYCMSEQKYDI